MNVADFVAQVIAADVALLFAWAAAHKTLVVLRGEARFQPLLSNSEWRVRYASSLLWCAAAAEAILAVCLIVIPRLGFLAAALILLAYFVDLGRLDQAESCNCFGALLESQGKSQARLRNVVLAIVCLICGSELQLRGIHHPVNDEAFAIALIVFSPSVAAAVLRAYRFQPFPTLTGLMRRF